MAKPTKFQIFEKEVRRWIKYFGLTSWSVDVLHYNASKSAHVEIALSYGTIVAWTGFAEFGHRTAVICLNKEYQDIDELNEKELSKTAFHEVCHVLLENLKHLSCMRFNVSEDTIDSEIHAVIATLENAIIK